MKAHPQTSYCTILDPTDLRNTQTDSTLEQKLNQRRKITRGITTPAQRLRKNIRNHSQTTIRKLVCIVIYLIPKVPIRMIYRSPFFSVLNSMIV